MMRPYVIISNLLTLAWFFALQYFRFKDTGRACTGEFLEEEPNEEVYLVNEGKFFSYYIAAHYGVYILQKIVCICITN